MYSAWVEFASKVRPGKFHADMFQKLNSNRVMLKADAVPIIIKDNCQVCGASCSFN